MAQTHGTLNKPRYSFSKVDRALILLCLASPSKKEIEEVRYLFLSNPAWDEFQTKIQHNDIAPLVYLNIMRAELTTLLPPNVLSGLENRYTEIQAKNTARSIVSNELFERFSKAGVPVIALKGVLFAETIYKDVGYKKMNDLDIFIHFKNVQEIKQIYSEMGLAPLALLEGGDEEENETKSYHLPAYVSQDLKFVVGTHWMLCSPKLGFKLNQKKLWDDSLPITINGKPARALSPKDALHHLVVHFHYYKTGLKELSDFINLIRSVPKFPWTEFSDEIANAGTWTPAFRTLSLVHTLFPALVPDELLSKCKNKAEHWTARDTRALCNRRDILLTSRSVYSSEIEKAYLAFSFENAFFNKLPWFLTFWKRLFFPPQTTLCRINAKKEGENSLFWLWVMNIWRTSREVGRSYGIWIFLLLMLKSSWELLQSILPNHSHDQMAELRKNFGVDDTRLRELMNSME
ncbi:MAG: nucleotidyltransferase family protein [Candidatus Riflebacteria bacterium]|nr:nucleotidyltransferase family protein [Candidatus Riflebacteria bacterium]